MQLVYKESMTIRRLRLVALIGAILFIGISVAVTLWGLGAQRDDALLINLAGRQRMLIQQMALESLNVQIADNPASRRMLRETADLFEQTLDALAYGGAIQMTEGRPVTLSPPDQHDAEIIAQLDRVRRLGRVASRHSHPAGKRTAKRRVRGSRERGGNAFSRVARPHGRGCATI